MKVITSADSLKPFRGCAFVPTMGALHDGHLSLIREAKNADKTVVVSIFVNPEQFAPEEDLDKYPRNLEQDCAFAESVGADVVFAPSVETMYPTGSNESLSNLHIPWAATKPLLEDACRPTHFLGVCVAVARLFDLVQPSITVFGLKDYQQYLVIKQLIEQEGKRWSDLQIIGAGIIRDDGGLAMSSRNVYLTTDQRSQALGLHKAIRCSTEKAMLETLDVYGLDVEYAVIRDSETLLAPIEGKPTRALVAARLGHIRLIDNAPVNMGVQL
ncbi:MAG: pantoate--beta-alanine ligase [Phycisphaerae bacterium]|nr:pantoate--beta-alanine ligase [Phycisphaerae bacterium]